MVETFSFHREASSSSPFSTSKFLNRSPSPFPLSSSSLWLIHKSSTLSLLLSVVPFLLVLHPFRAYLFLSLLLHLLFSPLFYSSENSPLSWINPRTLACSKTLFPPFFLYLCCSRSHFSFLHFAPFQFFLTRPFFFPFFLLNHFSRFHLQFFSWSPPVIFHR